MNQTKTQADTRLGSVIVDVEQLTAEWLTATLAASGALTSGAVIAFDLATNQSNWADNARLHLAYSDDAVGDLPEKLFLKMTNTDTGDGETFGESEVVYYTQDYVDVADAPLARCYNGVFSAELQRYHLLLDDLSNTHIEALHKPLTFEHSLALAEAFATLHARWWGAERLAEAGAEMHDAAHIQRFVDIAELGVDHILGAFASCPAAPSDLEVSVDLEPHWPDLLRDLYANHPQALIERSHNPNGFTLIHGDANYTNILVPCEGDRPIYLLDRQPFNWSLTTWLGVYDLVYTTLLDWPPEMRRRWEVPVLKHYHQQLELRGVTGYTWEQLYHDYRLCIPMGVYIATEYCRGGINIPLMFRWQSALHRSLTACDDLECAELWQKEKNHD